MKKPSSNLLRKTKENNLQDKLLSLELCSDELTKKLDETSGAIKRIETIFMKSIIFDPCYFKPIIIDEFEFLISWEMLNPKNKKSYRLMLSVKEKDSKSMIQYTTLYDSKGKYRLLLYPYFDQIIEESIKFISHQSLC